MMRDEKYLRDYAERYDDENNSPFVEPDENVLKTVSLPTVEECQRVMNFDTRNDENGANAGKRHNESAGRGAKNGLMVSAPPATNRGLVKYDGEEYLPNWGGYDGGIEASIFGDWKDENAFNLFALQVNRCKQAADDGDLEASMMEVGKFVWKVSEKGAICGFFKYKWVLESHGVKLYAHSNPKNSIPAFRVRFGAECLMRTNLFEAVETLKNALREIGFIWETEKVLRVDMQVLLSVDIYEFVDAMKGSRVAYRFHMKISCWAVLSVVVSATRNDGKAEFQVTSGLKSVGESVKWCRIVAR